MMTHDEEIVCWAMVHVFKGRPHGCEMLWFDDRLYAVTIPLMDGEEYSEITITPKTYELDDDKLIRIGYSEELNLMVMSNPSKDIMFGSNIRQ